ncbi:chemotaxis protein [Thermopirellula anaerolimosa]
MSHLSQLLLEKEILLESGTNELEVLVFNVADYTFGINVAKVREVLPAPAITQLPKAHPSIRGVFKLRNQVIPCVSLMDHLGIYSTGEHCESTAILTDLNQQQTAFLVDRVERIYRLSWENVLAVPGLTALSRMPVTALTRCGDRLILMLDFEMILDEVTNQYFRTHCVENVDQVPRDQALIVFVEDSPTVREAVVSTLRESGYQQVISFENGKEAWSWLEAAAQKDEPICDLVIADVEMPQVDGHHLTKRIKSDPRLRHIPVLLYSSIITPENRKKGESVGADEQIAKPDLCRVVQLADDLIRKAGHGSGNSPDGAANARENTQLEEEPGDQVFASNTQASSGEKPASDRSQSKAERDRGESAAVPSPGTPSAEASASGESPANATASCDQSAVAESEGDEYPVPPGKNRRLWQTFIQELDGRRRALSDLIRPLDVESPDFDALVDMARILHTVKSASMVVPVDEVTRCTHLVEELVVRLQQAAGSVSKQCLERYVAWLDMLVSPPDGDVTAALRSGTPLAEDLERMLAGANNREAMATA